MPDAGPAQVRLPALHYRQEGGGVLQPEAAPLVEGAGPAAAAKDNTLKLKAENTKMPRTKGQYK